MNDEIYSRINQSEAFHHHVAKRQRFVWILSISILLVYYLFILFIAFAPELLGVPLMEGSVITVGIPVGIAIIFFVFLITGLYVYKANGEFDHDRERIIKEVMK